MSFKTTFWIRFSIFNLMLVALLGLLMRYKILFEFPLLDQKSLQHSHSHFAFAGWVTHTLITLLIAFLQKQDTLHKIAFKKYNLELALAKQRSEELKPIVDAIAGVFERSLSTFIDNFVDGFKDGQLAIEDFQAALKELGKTILKELAKLALLTAIRAISESVAPGSGAGTAGVASRLLGTAAPRIGPGLGGGLAVGPGGLAIQGNVTFVQRGQDLVGVLARSNARINRVG